MVVDRSGESGCAVDSDEGTGNMKSKSDLDLESDADEFEAIDSSG